MHFAKKTQAMFQGMQKIQRYIQDNAKNLDIYYIFIAKNYHEYNKSFELV